MKSIKLLAIMEANSITGPAKNLLHFARTARSGGAAPAVEVSVAVFQRPDGSDLFIQAAREMSVPVYPIAEAGRFDRRVMAGLSALGQSLQPDVVESHAVKSHFLVRKSGLNRLAPWVAFHHGYTWPDVRARLYNQLDRWSLRAASRVVTVSQPFRQVLIRHGVPAARIEIVHNAIEPDWGRAALPAPAELRARLGIDPARKVILIVGRLSREKDHLALLRALSQLAAPRAGGGATNIHLLIVGEGPERPSIEAAIRDLGLGEVVTLTGQVPSAEPYYGIADLAVLSSLSEGSPNALLEAMAARVPVVATAVGGIPEIVSDRETALLVPPRNPEALCRAMRELLANETLAGGLAARASELILTRHTPEARTRRLVEIYTAALASQERYSS
ncbi:MAG TPA: glycosyltransferase family 4 protein [Bryobacteraceae bacterium]|jgi:glycosyltransferase involved in cell wall biosynthesis